MTKNSSGTAGTFVATTNYSVLDKTLSMSEWVFVSYKTIRQQDVPIFIKTEDNEEVVCDYARKLNS